MSLLNRHLWLPDKKWSLLFLLIAVPIYLIILIFSFTTSPEIFNPKSSNNETAPGARKPLPDNLKKYDEVQGFTLKTYQDDRIAVSIKAESYSVEDKKIGVFRMGLLKEARIKNLEVNLFNYFPSFRDENDQTAGSRIPGNDWQTQPTPDLANTPISFQTGQVFNTSDITFNGGMAQHSVNKPGPYLGEEIKALFTQTFNKSTSGGKIFSWIVENFAMNIYSGDKILLSTIRSNSAVMSGTSSSINFKGSFIISSKNGKTLKAGRAVYDLHKNVFAVSAPYSIEPRVRKEEGILEVDAFLERLPLVY